jgi:large subunit ribosomal protein L19e
MILQKRLAAQVLGCSPHRIRLDQERIEDIKGAITKADIRGLVKDRAIYAIPIVGGSRGRARKRHLQKRKGRQKGVGTRKGKKYSRVSAKRMWIEKIRAQKTLLNRLRENKKIGPKMYRVLRRKAKGGFFRSVRHIRIYLSEQQK